MIKERKYIIQGIFILVAIIFIVRLFQLQVLDSEYKLLAQQNAARKIIEYPFRGLIYSREGERLVENKTVFDLMMTQRETDIKDTLEFCNKFGITKEDFMKVIKEIRRDAAYNRPTPLIKQLSFVENARIQELLLEYKGLFTQPRTIRSYPYDVMANALGYIGEISRFQLETQKDPYYSQGDYIGISGLESYYEKILRGTKGVRFIMVDRKGALKGRFKNGDYDTLPEPGMDLYTSIDLELQKYGEQLMAYKKGGIVAIEPSTGEILAIVSSPSYNPNMLTGRKFSKNAAALQKDSLKPLFNRPLMAMYPPGSIFKLPQALIALDMGVIHSNTLFACNKEVVNCHPHPSPQDVKGSIQFSCNPYYYQVFRKIINQDKNPNKFKDSEIGFDQWYERIRSFGFGKKLGVDLPNEKGGIIPSNKFYDKVYGDLRWKFSTIYSLGIGQGEIGIIPIQMANLAAIIANRGYYYTPHLVKGIGPDKRKPEKFLVKHHTMVDPKHYEVVIDGMEQVVLAGTAAWSQIKGLTICGKTGTAQNPHGEDHAVFIAFAPKENPKIAIAVFVENAGFGGTWAAPIANLMIEKYLNDTTSIRPDMEKYILNKHFITVNRDSIQ
ncbi:MAG: penicillin-binding protein 2 [Cytophagaceae bacterium]|nr:penicillin-binding protein 2 [Cytophagaceae bacterium]